jgi:hypothetical protein
VLLSSYARAYKYQQVTRLFEAYSANKFDPFDALAVELRSGGKSIVTPPVVEEWPVGPVVIEGTTRAAYCFNKKIASYRCIVVRGVEADLPGTPVPIDAVAISERSLTLNERTQDYESSLFRLIERSVHPY